MRFSDRPAPSASPRPTLVEPVNVTFATLSLLVNS